MLLVVEDDESISTAIGEYFSRAGYRVKTVADGLAGVKSALDDDPAAVVLDQFDLLRFFASNPGRVFPRKYLLEKIWDYSYEDYDRTIDSHINRLRAKIEENPRDPQMVLTVSGALATNSATSIDYQACRLAGTTAQAAVQQLTD